MQKRCTECSIIKNDDDTDWEVFYAETFSNDSPECILNVCPKCVKDGALDRLNKINEDNMRYMTGDCYGCEECEDNIKKQDEQYYARYRK